MSGDGLRDELARAITASLKDGQWRSTTPRDCAAAVLPVVQAHIDAARRQAIEQIARQVEPAAQQLLDEQHAAEQAVQRVRELADEWGSGRAPAAAAELRRALDGTP